MKIDGVSNSGAARRGMKKDREQQHLLKKRKQVKDKIEDKLFQILIERELGL
jgi:hypothetical protein